MDPDAQCDVCSVGAAIQSPRGEVASTVSVEQTVPSSSVSCDQESLACTVKSLHAKLRTQVKAGKDVDLVWSQLLSDKAALRQYSLAMQSLATGPWVHKDEDNKVGVAYTAQGVNRITWCVDTCHAYFKRGGALETQLLKDLRRRSHQMPTLVPLSLLPQEEVGVAHLVEGFLERKLRLLDVGSCYNPFKEYHQFEVTAVDIAPANQTVQECDFMSVHITKGDEQDECTSARLEKHNHSSEEHTVLVHTQEHTEAEPITMATLTHTEAESIIMATSTHTKAEPIATAPLTHLEAESFDIVIFSLLLSYLPLSSQRLQCCVNAHRCLRLYGLLLVVTPDSSHQNRHVAMMRSWKEGIEALGFHRWRYVKDTHMHCMAFRKTRVRTDYAAVVRDLNFNLYIPQDSLVEKESHCGGNGGGSGTSETGGTLLAEMPFADV